MKVTRLQLSNLAIEVGGIKMYSSEAMFTRKFRSLFGVSVKVMAKTWNSLDVQNLLPEHAEPKHILWMCSFLKTYTTENVYVAWYKVEEKTFRKWVWLMLVATSKLEIVSSKKKLLFGVDLFIYFQV